MSKNILLVSKASKEESQLASILSEINFGVFLHSELSQIKGVFEQKSIQMVILFERAIKDQVPSLEPWLEEVRHRKVPILWIATPTFAQEHDFLKKDQILLWPMDIDLVVDAIETSIGLPHPPEEKTQKIDEPKILIEPRKVAMDPPAPKVDPRVVEAQKKEKTYLRDIQMLREELKKTKDELHREREILDSIRSGLSKLMEVMKK